MGRRILKSLRRPQSEKSLDVKIEVDDGTVFEVNNGSAVFMSNEKEQTRSVGVEHFDELPEESIVVAKKRATAPQVYVPPKIWSEDFDSDSDNDVNTTCWYLGNSHMKRRNERRERIAYAAKSMDEREEPPVTYCELFDCCTGEYEEPYTYEEPIEHDFLDHEVESRHAQDSEPSSPNKEVTSLLSDSFDNANVGGDANEAVGGGEDEREGVELTTEDLFWKTRDVDALHRKTRVKRIKKKIMKRRKGRKHRKGRATGTTETEGDNETIVSLESTSTNGESTVISIKHVISDEEASGVAEREETTIESETQPDCTATSSPEDVLAPVESAEEAGPSKEDGASIETPPSPPSSSKAVLYSYESLSRDGSEEDEQQSDRQEATAETTAKNEDSVLNRVFNAVESGFGMLAFPEIPQPKRKPKSRKRVRFAPDVKFNDEPEEYDYSLDYSYSDPEFDDGESFDEESYYTTEDEEDFADDDDEAFFDDTPLPRRRESTDEATDKATAESDEPCVYDANDPILDFDEEDSEAVLDRVLETEFAYIYPDNTGDEDESSINEVSSSYKSFEEMQVERETSPFEPTMKLPSGSSDTEQGHSQKKKIMPVAECPRESSAHDDSNTTSDLPAHTYIEHEDLEEDIVSSTRSVDALELDAIMMAADAVDESCTIGRPVKKPLKPPAYDKDGLSATSSTNTKRAKPARYNTPYKPETTREISPNEALVERYLNISSSYSDRQADIDDRSFRLSKEYVHETEYYSEPESVISMQETVRSDYVSLKESEYSEPEPLVSMQETIESGYASLKESEESEPEPAISVQETLESSNASLGNAAKEQKHAEYRNAQPSRLERKLAAESRKTGSSRLSREPVSENEYSEPEPSVSSNESIMSPKSVASVISELNVNEEVSGGVDERDDFDEWLHSPETAKYLPVMRALAKREVAREGWPSLLNPSTATNSERRIVGESTSATDEVDSKASYVDDFDPKNDAAVARLTKSSKYTKSKGRISDKKESLQLSLQGFARAKDTTKDWANFNNKEFQDLEVAPFDEQ